MHFILILGMIGLNKEGQIIKAHYDCKNNADDFAIETGDYINSLDVLVSNFKNANFTLIATQDAKDKQKQIFQNNPKVLQLLETTHIIKTNDLGSIFDLTLDIIRQSQANTIILDITHGLRHQPLMAAFASTLGKINFSKTIKTLYAQEIETRKKYSYVFLDDYNDIATYAILLNGFIKTLSLPDIPHISRFIDALQRFTDTLHTNAFNELFTTTLPEALSALQELKQNPMYSALENLIIQTEELLNSFQNIKEMQYDYQKYYEISKIMFSKKYYLISITYGFESLPKYVLQKFKENGILKVNNSTEYEQAQAIQQFVLQKIAKNEIFAHDKACLYYDTHQKEFEALKKIWSDLKDIRNNLVHINQNFCTKDLEIKLEKTYQDFYALCIKDEKFKQCDFSKLIDLETLVLKIYKYFYDNFTHNFSKDNFGKMCNFVKEHKENGKPFPISESNQNRLKNNKKAQTILNFLYQHKNSDYLTKEQCAEINKIL